MYESQVKAVAEQIAQQPAEFFANSVDRTQLLAETKRVLANLEKDVARVKSEGAILFATSNGADNSEAAGHKLAAAFDTWRENAPSTVAFMLVAAEKFGLDAGSPNFKAALMTGLAAEVKHDNAYHSTSHFREVTAVMTRLIGINNELAVSGTAKGAVLLDSDDISKCLAAAAAHDLMHDGKGNSIDGKHVPYRLENKAIAAAEPFLKLAGMSEKDTEDFRVIIRVTDISANNDVRPPFQRTPSPHKQLRNLYAEKYEGGKDAGLSPELQGLRHDAKLLIAASMMSDADLGPSAATDYAFSRKMTSLVAAETPSLSDSDGTLVGFMKFVVENRFTSAAASAGNGKSLAGIFNEASARVEREKALQATGPAQTAAPAAPPAPAAAPAVKPQGAKL